MDVKTFYLAGETAEHGVDLDISQVTELSALQEVIANNFGIVAAGEVGFQDKTRTLETLVEIESTNEPISVTISGQPVRETPGPEGLPYVGSYLQIFPDHLGNNQRLFERYGPVFKSTSMGVTSYQTNDPRIAQLALTESAYFSKEINKVHPLFPIKNDLAGVFLGDSSSPNWNIVHKYMPPALGPKAVRHYSKTMNDELRMSLPVFDELESTDSAWNVYQYMLKLSSATVGKIVLGIDFEHFTSVDAPLHRMPLAIAHSLALNKKVASMGEWYSHLPFGDPKRLRNLQEFMQGQIDKVIEEFKGKGVEDLPLQDAALKAENLVDYFNRAVDNSGNRLPKANMTSALIVAAGAGFTTTSSLLSWLIYGLVTYPGMQERLVQELVNHDFKDDMDVTPELIEDLNELDKYVKEMQRKHNPSYQPGRTAQRDLILPGGLRMRKGEVIIAALHHIHNNPKVWENPDRFDPDRWETEKVKKRGKTDYIPFAAGQRMCVGFNFALQEVKIFIAQLVWRYEWIKDGNVETEYDPFFQLIRPVNLYVRTKRRTVYPSKSI
ncbi:putative cytochrome P450 monooxygenase, partial [Aureobasidium melanogenum]|uniref:Putative cytochrome P450 monooxygenase n=1 Tax=Aureobasidium melanogenum (strain CBS 110374) TaxID=1043003 RepID=A0A074WMN0_AURM1